MYATLSPSSGVGPLKSVREAWVGKEARKFDDERIVKFNVLQLAIYIDPGAFHLNF